MTDKPSSPGCCSKYPLRVSYPSAAATADNIQAFICANVKSHAEPIVSFGIIQCDACGGFHLFVNQVSEQDKR